MIRSNVVGLLRLLADADAQTAYERNVPIANVPAELHCMWFDDLRYECAELERRQDASER